MFFSSRNKKDRLDLILDIQSSVVRGSLMLIRKGAVPRILWTKNIDIPYRAHGGSAYLIKMAVHAVEEISGNAHIYLRDNRSGELLPVRINTVHCVLASPWIVSRARTISQEFPKETRITRSCVADIIKAERSQMSSGNEDGLMSIEEKIFDVRVNGYSVASWEGNIAKNLEVSFAISLAGTRMIERFSHVISQAGAYHKEVRFHSSLLLEYSGIGLALSINEPYILIHIHGELTDLVIADAHSCILFGSYPIGIHTVVRKVAHALNISDTIADSLIAIHESAKLDTVHNQAAIIAIGNVARRWRNEYTKLTSLVLPGRLPDVSVILAHTHEDFFNVAMRETSGSMRVKNLSVDEFGAHVSFDPGAERLRLTMLYAVAIRSMETL
jgi:hypothetical protein